MSTRDPDEFEIRFISAGVDKDDTLWLTASRARVCPVKFQISRGNQLFEATVFVDEAKVAPVDYIKQAAHMLSLDFERLARQTADWRLPEDELPIPPADADEATSS